MKKYYFTCKFGYKVKKRQCKPFPNKWGLDLYIYMVKGCRELKWCLCDATTGGRIAADSSIRNIYKDLDYLINKVGLDGYKKRAESLDIKDKPYCPYNTCRAYRGKKCKFEMEALR
jgi:hypothetical protein